MRSARIPPRCDVAVVGAGPAGAAAARWLALAGRHVVLVERSRFDTPRVGESLAPTVQPLLAQLGVWPQFMALEPLASYGTRSIWGSASPESSSHLASPWGCGWHVDRTDFDRMLANAACEAGATLHVATTLAGCERTDGWMLTLVEHDAASGAAPRSTSVHAQVVIDATGRAARLASRLGARRNVLDRLVGIGIELAEVDGTSEGYVMVETTADGWWYTAPVPGGRMMAMLMTDSDLCGRGELATADRWHERLRMAPATRERVAAGVASWGPRVFSAVSQRLRRGERCAPWLAVGDAAFAVDPISGSGVARALRSARAGAEAALALLDGDTPACIAAHDAAGDAECAAYLTERARYYGAEQRWSESPFWRRRGALA